MFVLIVVRLRYHLEAVPLAARLSRLHAVDRLSLPFVPACAGWATVTTCEQTRRDPRRVLVRLRAYTHASHGILICTLLISSEGVHSAELARRARERERHASRHRSDREHRPDVGAVAPFGVGSGPMHAPGEQLLRASKLRWTILRPAEFMSNALRWVDTIRTRDAAFEPTGDGRTAVIDPVDIAAVAARVLTTDGHESQTSQHMANEPDLPVGSGRYGGLIPAAVALFGAAWEPG